MNCVFVHRDDDGSDEEEVDEGSDDDEVRKSRQMMRFIGGVLRCTPGSF